MTAACGFGINLGALTAVSVVVFGHEMASVLGSLSMRLHSTEGQRIRVLANVILRQVRKSPNKKTKHLFDINAPVMGHEINRLLTEEREKLPGLGA